MRGYRFQHITDEMQGPNIKERIEIMHEKLTKALYELEYVYGQFTYSIGEPYFIDWGKAGQKNRNQYRYDVSIYKQGRTKISWKQIMQRVNNIKAPYYGIIK